MKNNFNISIFNNKTFFEIIKEIKLFSKYKINHYDDLNLKELSMGMSSDFENAVINGSTFLRLGTLIMGERNIT